MTTSKMIESRLALILKREELGEKLKSFKTEFLDFVDRPFEFELLDLDDFELQHNKTLKEYQELNSKIFTLDLVIDLAQYKLNHVIFENDKFAILKSRSSYFDQGLKLVKK